MLKVISDDAQIVLTTNSNTNYCISIPRQSIRWGVKCQIAYLTVKCFDSFLAIMDKTLTVGSDLC